MKKIAIISLVAFFSIYLSLQLFFYLSAGFREYNISSTLPQEYELSPPLTDEAKRALSQSYTYFDKGYQTYVFLSEDGQYVLKFLKLHRVRLNPFWTQLLPSSKREERLQLKMGAIHEIYTSWKLSYFELPQETQTIFAAFNSKREYPTVTVTDRMGSIHRINLSETPFLIQRRGVVLSEALKSNPEEAKMILTKLVGLLRSEYERGYQEPDKFVLRNMGVYKGEVFHIDSGRITKNNLLQDLENSQVELKRKLREVLQFLEQYPELHSYLLLEIEK